MNLNEKTSRFYIRFQIPSLLPHSYKRELFFFRFEKKIIL